MMTKHQTFAARIAANDVTGEEQHFSLHANESDRAAIKERLKLVSIDEAKADLRVFYDRAFKAIRIEGEVTAKLAQSCVATLEPVDEQVQDTFTLLLVSPEVAASLDEDEAYLDADAPDYDALDGDHVELGDIAIQTIAMSMSQYPRHPDAALDAGDRKGVTLNEALEDKPNPFAALSKLRDNS